MSGRAVGFVLDHYGAESAAARARKSVLVAIADGCDTDGRRSTRSLVTVAARVGFHVTYVRRCVRALESEGWLRATPRRGHATVFDLTPLAATSQGEFDLVDKYATPRLLGVDPETLESRYPETPESRLTVLNGLKNAPNLAVATSGLAEARAQLHRRKAIS